MFRNTNWTLERAVAFCRTLESVSPQFGAHVALTGGTLYRDGERKDVDILVYRIRQFDEIDWDGLFRAWFTVAGVTLENDYGWRKKAKLRDGSDIDFFDAEDSGDFEPVMP